MTEGLVSVIIPTYNRFEFLLHALQSILNQTYLTTHPKGIEIIVINDCSDDPKYKSFDYKDFIKDKCLFKIIHLDQNMRKKFNVRVGQGLTRNEGLKQATGEWIAFLDDDDYWLETKIETQLNALNEMKKTTNHNNLINSNPDSNQLSNLGGPHEILMCSSNMLCGKDNPSCGKYDPMKHKNGRYRFMYNVPKGDAPTIFIRDNILSSNPIATSTVFIHHSVIGKTGIFGTMTAEDWDYWKRATLYTKCLYLHEPLVYYDNLHGYGQQYETKKNRKIQKRR